MDFSENYTCTTLEEIQSAYWNSSMVTLHPVVIYYRSVENQLEHCSYVYVSEILSHNSTMVISIVDKVVEVVKRLVPNASNVHFWTDSPSSQYRNKTIFDFVSTFNKRYGLQGKALIQDAHDFFAWASTNDGNIKYELVTDEHYETNKVTIDKRNSVIKSVKGTMKLHAVIGTETRNGVWVRNTSCACNDCFQGGTFNVTSTCVWEHQTILEKRTISDHSDGSIESGEDNGSGEKSIEVSSGQDQSKETNVEVENSQVDKSVTVGQFLIALYEGKRYIGQACEIDGDDNTVLVKFMINSGKFTDRFKWPTKEDKIWIELDDIIRKIDDPQPTGKTSRIFTVHNDILTALSD